MMKGTDVLLNFQFANGWSIERIEKGDGENMNEIFRRCERMGIAWSKGWANFIVRQAKKKKKELHGSITSSNFYSCLIHVYIHA